MPIQLVSGDSGEKLTVDAVSNASRVTLYGTDGAEITKLDRTTSLLPNQARGIPFVGSDYKTARLVRTHSDGRLIVGTSLELADRMDGAAYNPNKWIQTLTTMTMTVANGIMVFNAGSSAVTTVGAQLASHKFFIFSQRQTLSFRAVANPSAHFSNNLIELGFGSAASATAAGTGNGAVWRKDGTGQWIPVISINGSETFGTGISSGSFTALLPVGQYASFEVILTNSHAEFSIYSRTGVLLFNEVVNWPTNSASFSTSRVQAFMRVYNSAATGTAVQLSVTDVTVFSSDLDRDRPWSETQAGNFEGGVVTSPTTFGALEVYTNNAAPGTATPSNTATVSTAFGGLAAWNNAGTSFAASDTLDLLIFGQQVPSPYGLVIKGIRIDSINLGAANGAASYVIQWFLGVNASALSLATAAPYPHMRKVLGFQSIAASAAIGTLFNPIDVKFSAGIYVAPGRYAVIGARVIGASAATASQVIRTACSFDGYFE